MANRQRIPTITLETHITTIIRFREAQAPHSPGGEAILPCEAASIEPGLLATADGLDTICLIVDSQEQAWKRGPDNPNKPMRIRQRNWHNIHVNGFQVPAAPAGGGNGRGGNGRGRLTYRYRARKRASSAGHTVEAQEKAAQETA